MLEIEVHASGHDTVVEIRGQKICVECRSVIEEDLEELARHNVSLRAEEGGYHLRIRHDLGNRRKIEVQGIIKEQAEYCLTGHPD